MYLTASDDPAPTVCSAPGKVLVAGGYLILERPHAGTVLALDARFRTLVQLHTTAPAAQALAGDAIVIEVFSPQFRDHRRYAFRRLPSGVEIEPLPLREGEPLPRVNRYVELPLLYSLSLLNALVGATFFERAVMAAKEAGWKCNGSPGLQIVLAADNGFYSQTAELRARGWPVAVESLRRLPAMLPPRPDPDGEIAKTGLGSSATLVTSLVAALLHRFGALELPQMEGGEQPGGGTAVGAGGVVGGVVGGVEMLHSLAQLSHCAAQGKVGSGFDVCAAVHGSHRYTRFSPAVLREGLAMADGSAPAAVLLRTCVPGHAQAVAEADDAATQAVPWDHCVSSFELPPEFEVLMADVSCGANTPSMVKQVAAWRKEDSTASALWAAYAEASAALQDALAELCALYNNWANGREEWVFALGRCAAAEPGTWAAKGSVGKVMDAVRTHTLRVRELLREISTRSAVPIEPPEQTKLLDATMAQRGVLMAVVPGAGGCDAVLAIALTAPPPGPSTGPDVRQRLAALWGGWSGSDQTPADGLQSRVCELPVRESVGSLGGHNGVLLEGSVSVRSSTLSSTNPSPSPPLTLTSAPP